MIPPFLQSALWSVSVNKLDLKRDKSYIIHQVLAYGTWEQLQWLFRTYSKSEIGEVFVSQPAKDYLPASYNFVKDILLGLTGKNLDESKYVRTFPRNIGPE